MRAPSPQLLLACVLVLAASAAAQMMDPNQKKSIILTKVNKNAFAMSTKCVEGLSESYGFISTSNVRQESLQVCPSSNTTCCTFESQKVMILQMQVDAKNIQLRFDNQNKILNDLFSEIQLDMRYIERFKKRQEIMAMSNCKAIATKLSFHDIDHVKAELIKHREEMLEFVQRAHKGVYCAVCNPDSQRFLAMETLTMRISTRFCRNLVVNTIRPMLFVHHQIKRFMNLLVKFMTNCDEHGHYTPNSVPDELILEYSTNEKVVRRCWENRNDPEWVDHCAEYCRKFDSMKFDEFWEPTLETFLRVTYYLKRRRMSLNLVEKNDAMLGADTRVIDVPLHPKVIPIIRNDLVVQEEDEVDPYHLEDLDALKRPLSDIEMNLYMTKFKNRRVVSGDIGGQITLSDFKVIYHTKGIDFEDLGRNSVATDSLLKSVIIKINAGKRARELNAFSDGATVLDAQPRGMMQIGGSSWLAKVGWSVLLAVVINLG